MSCEETREELIEAARGADLPEAARAKLSEHIALCEECAREFATQRQLTELLKQTAQTAPMPAMHLEQVIWNSRPRPVYRRITTWAGAAAIAAGIAIGVWVFRPVPPPPRVALQIDVPAIATKRSVVAPPVQRRATANKKSARTQMATNRRKPVAESEDQKIEAPAAEDVFVALPFARPLSPREPAQIVRVGMSRGSLMTAGFPIPAARMNDPVQADVVVGMDGTARAIRLVRQTSSRE